MKRVYDKELEVIVVEDPWTEFVGSSEESLLQRTASKPTIARFLKFPSWLAAALLTLIVHSLVIAPFLLGSPARKYQRPMSEGGAASAQESASGEFVSQLILINDLHISSAEEQIDSPYVVAQSSKQDQKLRQELAVLSSTPQLEVAGSEDGTDKESPTIEAVGNAAGRAMLFGRYMGQIKARIERAWAYPVNNQLRNFECTVQIKQSKKGEVLEVAMTRCENNPVWQLSLAKAIQAASPLPAPPADAVFTEVVTLNFDAILVSSVRAARSDVR